MNTHRISILAVLTMATLVFAMAAGDPEVGIGGSSKPILIPSVTVVEPGAVVGGGTVECTIALNGTSETDQVVSMATDHPEVYDSFPASVVVAAGHSSVVVPLTTVPVSGSVQTLILATCNGGVSQGTLTVNP